MVFGLGHIFKVTLLLVNAIAILNEERFLARSTFPTLPLADSHQLDGPLAVILMRTKGSARSITRIRSGMRRDKA